MQSKSTKFWCDCGCDNCGGQGKVLVDEKGALCTYCENRHPYDMFSAYDDELDGNLVRCEYCGDPIDEDERYFCSNEVYCESCYNSYNCYATYGGDTASWCEDCMNSVFMDCVDNGDCEDDEDY